MKVLWTDSAVAQLQAIHDYIAQTSPDYAVRIVDRLTRRSMVTQVQVLDLLLNYGRRSRAP